MASNCEICGRGPWHGKQVSHSHRRSSKTWNANIQKMKIWRDGRAVRAHVCTSCIKAGKVQRPPIDRG